MYVHASGYWFEDLDRLAKGTLDHNVQRRRERCMWMCVYVCAHLLYTQHSWETKSVCLKCWVILPLPPFWFPSKSFFSHKALNCVTVSVSTSEWLEGELCRGGLLFTLLSTSLCASLLQSSYAVCSFLYPLTLSTIPSLPSQLWGALLSLGQWSTNTTCSAPSCSKKPLSTLGATKNVTDTNGKGITYFCFLPSGLVGGSSYCSGKCSNRIMT